MQRQQFQYKNTFKIDIKKYKNIKQISNGGFGSVSLIQNQETQKIYAAKTMFTSKDKEQLKKMIDREISIMMQFQHPTIIKFYGFSETDFDEADNVTLIMEYAKKGSLKKVLHKSRKKQNLLNNTNRQIILVGIARGMMYLHQHRVIHRDLKPDNVLIDENFYPHISDFGLSKVNRPDRSSTQSQICGTKKYMAPEVFNTEKKYNGKADVYSFGILMYEVITNNDAYSDYESGKINDFVLQNKVLKGHRPEFSVKVKQPLKDLIEQCWSQYPNDRPAFEEIFKKLAFDGKESIYDDCDSLKKNMKVILMKNQITIMKIQKKNTFFILMELIHMNFKNTSKKYMKILI